MVLLEKIFQRNFEKPLDKYQKMWYNMYVRNESRTHKNGEKEEKYGRQVY
jgi:hypothetical protein